MAWPGGKDGAGVYQRLINQIPPHDVFISPFLGDCAVMRRKLPADRSIGIDLSRSNVERWAAAPPIGGLRLHCCCGIQWLRHAFDLHLVGTQQSATIDRAGPELSMQYFAARNGVPVPRVFVYLDPPYLLSTRRSGRAMYEHELSEEQHAELLETICRLPCPVMISHYPHQLYDSMLHGWRTFTFKAQTRGGRMAREKVWCNYPQPTELHDARFVGNDKRQRERVRRRVNNWVDGLARMEPSERQAVLDAIEGRFFRRLPSSRDSAAGSGAA